MQWSRTGINNNKDIHINMDYACRRHVKVCIAAINPCVSAHGIFFTQLLTDLSLRNMASKMDLRNLWIDDRPKYNIFSEFQFVYVNMTSVRRGGGSAQLYLHRYINMNCIVDFLSAKSFVVHFRRTLCRLIFPRNVKSDITVNIGTAKKQ